MYYFANNKFDTFPIYLPPYLYSWYSLSVCLLGAKDPNMKEKKMLNENKTSNVETKRFHLQGLLFIDR